jgi:UbiD family decarboxylase
MNLRAFLEWAEGSGRLVRLRQPVDPHLEMARVIHALDGQPVLFERVAGRGRGVVWRVASGVCARREQMARALGCAVPGVVPRLIAALETPVAPPRVEAAPCQEVVVHQPDLAGVPILKHLPGDGGPYVTSAVAVVRDAERGRNASYHRLMQTGPRTLVARVVEGRGTDAAWRQARAEGRDLPVAFCIGAPIHVLLAAATSPPPGVDELSVAEALAPTPLVRCLTSDLEVPADCELVLEGRITGRLADEGPFIDLTETWDGVRSQPVVEIDCLTHRRDPIYHALLPGGAEHKLLMGMPREPTIYQAVARVADCQAVHITPGGMSWLHAVVQIRSHGPGDGRRAIDAAFAGHGSLKHVVVVDEDVSPFDVAEVEWALATRVQTDRDLVVLPDQPSSSLDPSARQVPGQKARTAKVGVDATIPWADPMGQPLTPEERAAFRKVRYGPVDLAAYV